LIKNKARIFISPLDWGIGHATRMVPVIREFLYLDHEVVIGADGRSYDFLHRTFPDLEIVRFPGIKIRYPAKGSMTGKMLTSLPSILKNIRNEHKLTGQLVEKYHIDLVLSDNRFGLWTNRAKCIYITHQLMIKTPWAWSLPEKWLKDLHHFFINKYDQCWIPDLEGNENLSGDLSHKYTVPSNASFIGPLSRFDPVNDSGNSSQKKYKVLGIISGPEPQRSLFEDQLTEKLEDSEYPSALLRGIPGKTKKEVKGKLEIYPHLDDDDFRKLVNSSEIIIARPGYSTLMDLVMFRRNAIVVPTPGQTEQEYLANYHWEKKYFIPVEQDSIDINEIISISEKFRPLPDLFNLNLLRNKIKSLVT
jgi:uncharacterized protein (TIGR00661 family)